MMKRSSFSALLKISALLLLFVATADSLMAQVYLELSTSRRSYMQYEPIYVKVKMRNDSGRALVFGENVALSGKLEFEITNSRNIELKLKDKPYDMTGVVLAAGEEQEFYINLSSLYNITKPDFYTMKCYIAHSSLPRDFESNTVKFDVTKGIEVWSRTVGVPDVLGDGSTAVKERTYSIVAMRDLYDTCYYLKISDDKFVYAVRRIGIRVGIEQIRSDVDMLNRLHLLVPISPKVLRYIVCDLNGIMEAEQFFKVTDTIPVLNRDKNSGFISVVGGTEALPGVDYQPRTDQLVGDDIFGRDDQSSGVLPPTAPGRSGR